MKVRDELWKPCGAIDERVLKLIQQSLLLWEVEKKEG